MVVQVQKVGEAFVIPAQAVHDLGLIDGARVDIQAIEAAMPAVRHASLEDVMRAHRETEPYFAEAYEELAK